MLKQAMSDSVIYKVFEANITRSLSYSVLV